jgi:hypothetical protein
MYEGTTEAHEARPLAPRPLAAGVAAAMAAGEVVTAFFIEVPVAAIVMAALFVVAWALLHRDRLAGWVMLGVLSAVELAFLPTYAREDAGDWVTQGLFLVLSAVGLALVAAELRGRRR